MDRIWRHIIAFKFCCSDDEHVSTKEERNAFILVSETDNYGFTHVMDQNDQRVSESDKVINIHNANELPKGSLQNGSDQNDETFEHRLPDTSTWTHRPIFIQPTGDTKCPGHDGKKSLPIGVPIDFESDLFKGKILFRFRDGPSDDQNRCDAYFQGTNYNIKRQVIFQGKFKSAIKWSEGLYDHVKENIATLYNLF